MKRAITILVILLIAATTNAAEKNKLNIAVIDFKAQAPASPSEAAFVTEFFRGELVMADVFNVIEKENMDKILAEQGFQQTGCTTSDCAVKMGKILNTQIIIVGKYGKLADIYMLTVNAVSVETGKIIYSDNQACENINEIKYDVGVLVERTIDNIGGKGLERKKIASQMRGKHLELRKSISHRKNKVSISSIVGVIENGGYLTAPIGERRKFTLLLNWSWMNYFRIGIGTSSQYCQNRYFGLDYYPENASFKSNACFFTGRVNVLFSEISLTLPSVMEIFEYVLNFGKKPLNPSIGVPLLWRMVPFISFGFGQSFFIGEYANPYTDERVFPLEDNIHLYTFMKLGLVFPINQKIHVYFEYDNSNLDSKAGTVTDYHYKPYYGTTAIGIEYTF